MFKNMILMIVSVFLCNCSYILSETSDTVFPSGICMSNDALLKSLNHNSGIKPNEIIVERINSEKLIALIKGKNKTLIHVWGSWCPSTTMGLDSLKELFESSIADNIILISVDIYSKEQVEIIKKVLADKGIKIKTYILENELGKSMVGVEKFRTMEHAYNFISSFDKSFKKIEVSIGNGKSISIVPALYIAIINNNMEILYSKIPDIPNDITKEPDKKNIFIIDLQKIKKLLDL